MVNCEAEELLGLFEALDDNQDKVDMHKETIKMINKDTSDQIKTFAEEKEMSPSDLKEAYKYYQKRCKKGEDVNDDFFTLCALIDIAAENDNEGEGEN